MSVENINNFSKKIEKNPAEILLDDCDISIRAYQALKSLGITSIQELANYREEELITKLPNINNRTIKEAKELLISYNLDFKI